MARLTATRLRDAGGTQCDLLVGRLASGGAAHRARHRRRHRGYVLIEGWSPWDAFYMTVITVTTVGYGEVHPLSPAGAGLHGRHPAHRRRRVLLRVHAVHGAARRGTLRRAAGAQAARPHARRPHRPFHPLRLRAHGRDHRPRVRAPARRRSSIIERNPERMHLAMEQRLPRRRGGRLERGRAAGGCASIARAASSPRSAPTRRTSTRCSAPGCSSRTCSSSDARRPTTRGRS